MKVFVGLSGGVDSAVAAALLKKDGYEVTGAFIRIVLDGYPCTAGKDRIDAMRVAAHLQIPFVEVDLSEEYKKKVFEVSLREFAAGRTPNPDVLCNREIKFGLFFDWCRAHGADMVATGHYAQLQGDTLMSRCHLDMGADTEKDQSYFLALVPQEKLCQTLFPVGHLHKTEVRALAQKFVLPNAERPDSQGLCFLGPVHLSSILARELAQHEGAVLNEKGEDVGRHRGAALYTLGQRHGFEIQAAEPHYVVAKNIGQNTITVSPRQQPAGTKTKIVLENFNRIGPFFAEATEGEEVMARYRYRQQLIPAVLQRTGLGAPRRGRSSVVILQEPHYAPEGQVLALYKGERCMGGGII